MKSPTRELLVAAALLGACAESANSLDQHAAPTHARRVLSPVCTRACRRRRLESILHLRSNRRRRRLRRRRRPRRSRRPCRQLSRPDQRSLAGTSSTRAADVTLPHGTMHRILSRTASQRRSHPPTAWHQGGWAALRCRSRPVPSLQQAFELRSCHLLAPCPPSRGACASPSLWRGQGTSCSIVADLY